MLLIRNLVLAQPRRERLLSRVYTALKLYLHSPFDIKLVSGSILPGLSCICISDPRRPHEGDVGLGSLS
jgi:hypothetical protein